MPNTLIMLDKAEQLDFSQNFKIAQPSFLGDVLFPDQKTQNIKAEWLRLSGDAQLPTMALVHGLDTEAHIASRVPLDKISIEKLLIKEKINQSERTRLMRENGVYSEDSLVQYIFDDWKRLAEAVRCRTEVAKMEVLATGKMTIKENGISQTIDYQVPSANTGFTIDVSAKTTSVIDQIQAVVDRATKLGMTITAMVTSAKVLQNICKNTEISTLVHGTAASGTITTRTQLGALFQELFGFSDIRTDDLRYQVEAKAGTKATARYFPENKISFIATVGNGASFGHGLWGVTPEEEAFGQWSAKSADQYITLTQWATEDPVTVWSKASAMFVPVLPNPDGLLLATVTLPA